MTVHIQQLLNFQTFYSKQTSRYIKFFHCFPKFDTRSDHYGTFLNFECWILNDFSPYNNLLLNLEVFSGGWVIATKEQSYRSHTVKLEKPFTWLRFLGFISLRSKWQRSYLCLEYRKEKIDKRCKSQETGLLILNVECWMLNDFILYTVNCIVY